MRWLWRRRKPVQPAVTSITITYGKPDEPHLRPEDIAKAIRSLERSTGRRLFVS